MHIILSSTTETPVSDRSWLATLFFSILWAPRVALKEGAAGMNTLPRKFACPTSSVPLCWLSVPRWPRPTGSSLLAAGPQLSYTPCPHCLTGCKWLSPLSFSVQTALPFLNSGHFRSWVDGAQQRQVPVSFLLCFPSSSLRAFSTSGPLTLRGFLDSVSFWLSLEHIQISSLFPEYLLSLSLRSNSFPPHLPKHI